MHFSFRTCTTLFSTQLLASSLVFISPPFFVEIKHFSPFLWIISFTFLFSLYLKHKDSSETCCKALSKCVLLSSYKIIFMPYWAFYVEGRSVGDLNYKGACFQRTYSSRNKVFLYSYCFQSRAQYQSSKFSTV